jgi:hypothetical protein
MGHGGGGVGKEGWVGIYGVGVGETCACLLESETPAYGAEFSHLCCLSGTTGVGTHTLFLAIKV